MKSLVTGANGFVGSAVMRNLMEHGHDVRVFVRPENNRMNLQGCDVEIVEGDLRDMESLKKAVFGCNNLFHVAADYRLWIPDPEVMYNINVKGTVNILRAARDASLENIVYTSSVATLGLHSDGSPANEESPVTLENMIGHYKRSKYLAEQEVHKMIHEDKLPVVIVNPSTPIGPRDIKPTPTGKIILDSMQGRLPAYVDTGLNIVHVDDVAEGHYLAFKYGTIGERYILGGENLSLHSILEAVALITGQAPPRLRLPHNLVIPVAWCMERWATISGKVPMATVDSVRMSRKLMYFSSEKAVKYLHYKPRPALDAIRDAITWFADNHYTDN